MPVRTTRLENSSTGSSSLLLQKLKCSFMSRSPFAEVEGLSDTFPLNLMSAVQEMLGLGVVGGGDRVASFQNGRGAVIVALGSSSPLAAGLVTSAASKPSSSAEKGHLSFHLWITGIFHRSQQCVLKGFLKRNTCVLHHLPFKTASLPSRFPGNALPQPFNDVYKDQMVSKFIPQPAELPSFHARLCTEKRTLYKHARELVTYLGLVLPRVVLREERNAEIKAICLAVSMPS